MSTARLVVGIVLFLLLLGFVGHFDYQDECRTQAYRTGVACGSVGP